jgi:hypothetical protein
MPPKTPAKGKEEKKQPTKKPRTAAPRPTKEADDGDLPKVIAPPTPSPAVPQMGAAPSSASSSSSFSSSSSSSSSSPSGSPPPLPLGPPAPQASSPPPPQERVPFDRRSVKIDKKATDCVFGALPSYDALRIYGQNIYNAIANKGDNEQWRAAIAEEYEVQQQSHI